MTSVKTVYIELRASAEKLRADMANAKGELATIGTAGSTAGQGIARGMDQASISVRKVAAAASEGAVALATAHSALSAAVARYGGAVATSSVNTETREVVSYGCRSPHASRPQFLEKETGKKYEQQGS